MSADTKDLADIIRAGGRIIRRTPPGEAAPAPTPKPSESSQILHELRSLKDSLLALVRKPAPAAPVVHVDAPKVTVNPELLQRAFKKMRIRIESRDRDDRAEGYIIEVIE